MMKINEKYTLKELGGRYPLSYAHCMDVSIIRCYRFISFHKNMRADQKLTFGIFKKDELIRKISTNAFKHEIEYYD